MTWYVWVAAAAWIIGWLTWFSGQERYYESEIIFNLIFGIFLWPLLLLARLLRDH